MSRIAERVYTGAEEIAVLESRIAALDDEANVRLTLADGRSISGVVTVRPTLQTFRDAQGGEGANSLLRLDDLQQPGHSHYLWLDQVRDIFRLGSN